MLWKQWKPSRPDAHAKERELTDDECKIIRLESMALLCTAMDVLERHYHFMPAEDLDTLGKSFFGAGDWEKQKRRVQSIPDRRASRYHREDRLFSKSAIPHMNGDWRRGECNRPFEYADGEKEQSPFETARNFIGRALARFYLASEPHWHLDPQCVRMVEIGLNLPPPPYAVWMPEIHICKLWKILFR